MLQSILRNLDLWITNRENLTSCKNTNELGPAWQNSLKETITKENRFQLFRSRRDFRENWNNLKPFFIRNEELYVSKEVKENALASDGWVENEDRTPKNEDPPQNHL